MADRGALLALAERVEREEPNYKLWVQAIECLANDDRQARFNQLLTYSAYLDAADMLRPEGWGIIDAWTGADSAQFALQPFACDGRRGAGRASGPHAEARARLAAALRAHAAKEPTDATKE